MNEEAQSGLVVSVVLAVVAVSVSVFLSVVVVGSIDIVSVVFVVAFVVVLVDRVSSILANSKVLNPIRSRLRSFLVSRPQLTAVSMREMVDQNFFFSENRVFFHHTKKFPFSNSIVLVFALPSEVGSGIWFSNHFKTKLTVECLVGCKLQVASESLQIFSRRI